MLAISKRYLPKPSIPPIRDSTSVTCRNCGQVGLTANFTVLEDDRHGTSASLHRKPVSAILELIGLEFRFEVDPNPRSVFGSVSPARSVMQIQLVRLYKNELQPRRVALHLVSHGKLCRGRSDKPNLNYYRNPRGRMIVRADLIQPGR